MNCSRASIAVLAGLTALLVAVPPASAACSLVGACATAFPLQSGQIIFATNQWEPLHVAGSGSHSTSLSPGTGSVSITLATGASGACTILGVAGGSCTSSTPIITFATFPRGIVWCATAETTPAIGLVASHQACTST